MQSNIFSLSRNSGQVNYETSPSNFPCLQYFSLVRWDRDQSLWLADIDPRVLWWVFLHRQLLTSICSIFCQETNKSSHTSWGSIRIIWPLWPRRRVCCYVWCQHPGCQDSHSPSGRPGRCRQRTRRLRRRWGARRRGWPWGWRRDCRTCPPAITNHQSSSRLSNHQSSVKLQTQVPLLLKPQERGLSLGLKFSFHHQPTTTTTKLSKVNHVMH